MTQNTASKTARITTVVAATVVALACGTNYAYSAWAPEFGDRLKLSSTQINLIGTFGNLGTYSAGLPLGMIIDARGPKETNVFGAVCLGAGYFALYRAYDAGSSAPSIPWLCFFSFLTGIGSCAAFSGSVKVAALNMPQNRGTATAFPLAAYGLSALAFALLSHLAFPDNTSMLLLLLAIATFSMVIIGGLFMRTLPESPGYSALSNPTELSDSSASMGTKTSKFSEERRQSQEPGMQPDCASADHISSKDIPAHTKAGDPNPGSEEISSLLSKSSESDHAETFYPPANKGAHEEDREANKDDDIDDDDDDDDYSRTLDIRGLALLPRAKFWQIWIMLGLLTGIGLMTINNIGGDARALWHHWDDSIPPEFIQQNQLMHVEVLSFSSFCGRLASGIGSDFIVKKLNMSRYWCLFVSASIFLIAQICGAIIQTPQTLSLVSSLNGLGYGVLFGVCPTLVVEAFGIGPLSQNWGIMTLAPIPFGNLFNLVYGAIFDGHSTILPGGARDCNEGIYCYRSAYFVTMGASVLGIFLSAWSIRHDFVGKVKRQARLDRREA